MVSELRLSQQLPAGLVVADQVETVQGELAAQMGDEGGHPHLTPGPGHHGSRVPFEHSVQGGCDPADRAEQVGSQRPVLHSPVGRLPLLETPGRRDRPALGGGLQVTGDLDQAGVEVGDHLVGSPQRAPGQRVGWRLLEGLEEGPGRQGEASGTPGSHQLVVLGLAAQSNEAREQNLR